MQRRSPARVGACYGSNAVGLNSILDRGQFFSSDLLTVVEGKLIEALGRIIIVIIITRQRAIYRVPSLRNYK